MPQPLKTCVVIAMIALVPVLSIWKHARALTVGKGVLEVSVVEAERREPLTDAIVAITSTDDGPKQTRTVKGFARFMDLTYDRAYRVHVHHDSYVDADYCQTAADCSDAVTVGRSQDRLRIDVALRRAGKISGRVVDSEKHSIARAVVMLLGARRGTPNDTLPVMGAETDRHGDYHVVSVPPGRYYFAAHFSQPRRNHDGRELRARLQYFPGVSEVSRAKLVTVDQGREATGIDFVLPFEQGASLSGQIEGSTGQGLVSLMSDPDAVPRWYLPLLTVPLESRLTLSAVPPGKYQLRAIVMSPLPIRQGWTPVVVGPSNAANVVLKLEPSGEIRGHMTIKLRDVEVAPSWFAGVQIRLEPKYLDLGEPTSAKLNGSVFVVGNVFRGEYRVTITGLPEGWCVGGVRYGKEEIRRGVLALDPSGVDRLVVSLAPEAGAIDGLVRGDDRNSAVGSIVLLNWDGELVGQAALDSFGHFRFGNLRPGAYRLAAFQDADIQPYLGSTRRPSWMAQAVTLLVRSRKVVSTILPLIPTDPEILAGYPSSIPLRR